jgi:preprotein translocase SecE subunit
MNTAINFLKEAYAELKKVRFPTREEAIRLTAFVIGVSLAVGLFVSGFDYLFTEALEKLLIR